MARLELVGAQDPNHPVRDASLLARGRSVGDRIARKDVDGLFAMYTPQMAQQVTRAATQELLDRVVSAQASLGARESESTSEDNGLPVYVAVYRWVPGTSLQVTITFAGQGSDRIAGMLLRPVTASANTAAAAPTANSSDAPDLAAGRSVVALVARSDAGGLYRRFTPAMAKQFPQSAVRQVLSQLITSESPLGGLINESVQVDPETKLVTYIAECHWKSGQTLMITVKFVPGTGGRIAGLLLRRAATGALPPDPRLGYHLRARLHLPFAPGDTWTVAWGGDTRDLNYHVDYPDQRHAFDIYVVKGGRSHRGDGKRLEDYYAWGRRIVSPADATVIETVNVLPDNPIGKQDPSHATGNHVLLDLGNHEYALLAHLQHGSVRVRAGDHVVTGQPIGLCGNSGNTSEPHLHIHVQDKPYLFRDAIGLPVTFVDYVSNGQQVAAGSPVRSEQISAGVTTARAYP